MIPLRACLVAFGLVVAAIILLPLQVNAASSIADPGRLATFVPASYRQQCANAPCYTVTEGHLRPGGTEIFWPSRVPLDHPFTVPAPVWTQGTGGQVIRSRAVAVLQLAGPTLVDGLAIVLPVSIVAINAALLRRRRSARPAA